MDLQRLKWTKNITPQRNETWAYNSYSLSSLFELDWKNGETNASKPHREDLILLRQKSLVTHLVKVLDYKPEHRTGQGEFDIYRIVKVLWVIDWKNPPLAKADEVFGYSKVLKYQSGNVMELEKITSRHWESRGGFAAFQNHVHSQLFLE